MGQQIGYIRVSSIAQNTDRQLTGVKLNKTFTEKISAKDVNRPELQDCIDYIREGDTLHVHSIDRLARNLLDLQQIINTLTAKGVSIQFHKEHLIFSGDDDPMQKLQLQMMGAFAEFERSLIRERQREGIAAAKAAGKHMGRKAKLSNQQIQEIKDQLAQGATKMQLAKSYGVSRQTIYSIL